MPPIPVRPFALALLFLVAACADRSMPGVSPFGPDARGAPVAAVPPAATPWPEPSADEAWARAVARNTRRGYQEFLVVHPSARQATEARSALAKLWMATTLTAPDCHVTSNLSVELSWAPIEGADGYEVQWSQRKGFLEAATESERVTPTDFVHTARRGTYGAKLPMYYRVVAVGGGGASRPSEPCHAKLLPSEGGKRCQICGASSVVGYCHLRAIHVCAEHNIFRDDRGRKWRCP